MKTEQIRGLTEVGVLRFKDYVQSLRNGMKKPPPFELLNDNACSAPRSEIGFVEDRRFASRFEFGTYLRDSLEKFESRLLLRDHGIWSWIALYYFDQLCPTDLEGKRLPGEDARYVLPPTYNWRNYYRHLAREAWYAVKVNGEKAKPLLGGDMSSRGDLLEQVSSRQFIIGNPSVVSMIGDLYFNQATGQLRRGTGGKGAGSPRRLAIVLQQFDMTFDLRTSVASSLISILPKEFEKFKPQNKS